MTAAAPMWSLFKVTPVLFKGTLTPRVGSARPHKMAQG